MSDSTMTIGELSRRSQVPHSAHRFYESRGLIASVRTRGNQRRYQRGTLRRVALIRFAQAAGLTLRQVSDALETLPSSGAAEERHWHVLAGQWRADIERRIGALEALRDQVSSCIGCGCLSLGSCRVLNPDDRAARLGPGPRYLMGDRPENEEPAEEV